MREDLFTVVHEQFMTDTAKIADVVLPATMFLEHDDIYKGGGHQHISLGPKLIDPPEGPKPNHFVIEELAKRLGVAHMPGFGKTERELIDTMLFKRASRAGTSWRSRNGSICSRILKRRIISMASAGRQKVPLQARLDRRPVAQQAAGIDGSARPASEACPKFPDHFDVIENADEEHPFRLATSPARSFLNSTFQETPSSIAKEGRPELKIHPQDAAALGIADGDRVQIGNKRGEVILHASFSTGCSAAW